MIVNVTINCNRLTTNAIAMYFEDVDNLEHLNKYLEKLDLLPLEETTVTFDKSVGIVNNSIIL